MLIVIALAFVALGMAAKFQRLGGGTSATTASSAYVLPKGAQIVEMRSEPKRLILRLKRTQGEEIDIIDTQDGHLVARIQ